ncbi:hypothetical protein [Paraburkholderia sp. BCC1886]|uniref:hypothetical protein n=1 Tax=Paraburkholderia sp. BCC1886 TaxID=2562670 RepID=UPI0011828A53|nr:hypothetical protein [Paraburkholderia sp. BCC1886]
MPNISSANKLFPEADRFAPGAQPDQQALWISMVASSLTDIASEDVARLPEDEFVHVFLPFFEIYVKHLAENTSYAQLTKDLALLKHKVGMADWISIAGTPYKGVDVFDKSGAVLFRVPPVFEYQGVNPVRDVNDRSQAPLGEVMKTADQYMQIHPAQGTQFMNVALAQRLRTMRSGQHLVRHVLAWNAIMARYNRPPLIADPRASQVTAPAAAANTPTNPSSGEDVEYEDF